MDTKQLLLGAGLIGGAVFILPGLISGEESSSGGQSVGNYGFPASAGALDGGTKKESLTPTSPIFNIYESALTSPTSVIKETSSTPTTKKEVVSGGQYPGDYYSEKPTAKEDFTSKLPTPVSDLVTWNTTDVKKETISPTETFVSVVDKVVVSPVSVITSFFSRWF